MSEQTPKGFERRMVHRFLRHWREVQQEGGIPARDAILGRKLDPDIVEALVLLKVPDGDGDPVFERIGPALAGEVGGNLIGKPISAVPDGTLLKQGLHYFRRVVTKAIPITLGGEFVNSRGETILYRSFILPLSDGDGEINYLIAAANCKRKGGEEKPGATPRA